MESIWWGVWEGSGHIFPLRVANQNNPITAYQGCHTNPPTEKIRQTELAHYPQMFRITTKTYRLILPSWKRSSSKYMDSSLLANQSTLYRSTNPATKQSSTMVCTICAYNLVHTGVNVSEPIIKDKRPPRTFFRFKVNSKFHGPSYGTTVAGLRSYDPRKTLKNKCFDLDSITNTSTIVRVCSN